MTDKQKSTDRKNEDATFLQQLRRNEYVAFGKKDTEWSKKVEESKSKKVKLENCQERSEMKDKEVVITVRLYYICSIKKFLSQACNCSRRNYNILYITSI